MKQWPTGQTGTCTAFRDWLVQHLSLRLLKQTLEPKIEFWTLSPWKSKRGACQPGDPHLKGLAMTAPAGKPCSLVPNPKRQPGACQADGLHAEGLGGDDRAPNGGQHRNCIPARHIAAHAHLRTGKFFGLKPSRTEQIWKVHQDQTQF